MNKAIIFVVTFLWSMWYVPYILVSGMLLIFKNMSLSLLLDTDSFNAIQTWKFEEELENLMSDAVSE